MNHQRPSRQAWPWIAVVVASVAVAAAVWTIGGPGKGTAAEPSPGPGQLLGRAAATAAATAGAASAAPPVAPPPGMKVLSLGQSHTFTADGDTAEVTALAHQSRGDYPAVRARTCNKGAKAFTATPYLWKLSYGDGEELVDVQVTGGGLLSPAFVERDLAPGKCAKGWISWEASAAGSKPDGVEYRIDGVVSIRWEW
jgi:hypothetical protein